MPNPDGYTDRGEWLADCVPVLINEGREQDQAVAICSSMWDSKSAGIWKGAIFKNREDIIKVVKK
jgi:hypothetical protein